MVILRDKAGELRAFFNLCPHRAGPLAIGSGQCHRLTCLYHAWTFDLNGNLQAAPDMDEAEGFDSEANALTSVKVDTWGSFIFVNLDPHSESLAVQLDELLEMFERYHLHEWALVHSVDYWIDANWKLLLENAMEHYHEPMVHSSLAKYYKGIHAEAKHYHYLQYTPALEEEISEIPFKLKVGLYIDGLNETELKGTAIVGLFPNFGLILGPGYAITILIDPQGISKTRFRVEWLVPNTTAAKSSENVQMLVEYIDSIFKEDFDLLPHVQKRIQSLGYRQGRLCPRRECGTHLFQELVMHYLTQKEH